MRTIAAGWSLPRRPNRTSGSWLSNMGARVRSAWAARRHATRSAHVSRDPLVQADAAAFVSAFMRIG
jgi:hypothetical protein